MACRSQEGTASQALALFSVGLISDPRLCPSPQVADREVETFPRSNSPAWRGPSLTHPCGQKAQNVMGGPGIHHGQRPCRVRVQQAERCCSQRGDSGMPGGHKQQVSCL